MGIIWLGMLALAVVSAVGGGAVGDLTAAAMEGAASAITLCISLAGALCLWSGLAKVMEVGGLTQRLGRLVAPLLRRLFPEAARDETTLGCLTANLSANLLGLGNAATPMGVAAVKRMKKSIRRNEATDEMCLLIIMNSASVQLLPTTVAAVRASLGAATPFDILPAVWLTSAASVGVGIAAARGLRRFWGRG